MFASSLLAFATAAAFASAQVYKGFNYASIFTDGSAITQADYENEFTTAQQLVGTSGFTSARLFTMIQAGTTNTPTEAIPAAVSTKTSLLLGLFLSTDQAVFNNELAALSAAISTYGQDFIDLIAGISVGSEDLYRISPIGIENNSGAGVEPDLVAEYIAQVRSLIANTAASGKAVGHVDTWTAWVNSSNNAVIDASDFIGMDAYPYFQFTQSNAISSGSALFFDAYNATVAVSEGKPVWITETGWPVSGPTENLAVANVANAETYWDQVGCSVLGKINTWWYILQDAYPASPSPSFGVVGTTLSTTPLYNLSCGADSEQPSSSSTASPSSSASAIATSPAVSSASVRESILTSAASNFATGSLVEVPEASKDPSPSASTSPATTARHDLPSMATSKPALSLATVTIYTTVTTCPITYTSGVETKTSMITSAVILTSTVGNTMSTVFQAPTTTSNSVSPGTSQMTGSCPSSLSANYQYPHLIVAINKNYPDAIQGNSYNAHFSPTISSIFNFDIPVSYKDMACSLVFLFPNRESMQTSNYTVSGSGGINVAQLQNPVTEETTYNTVSSAVAAEIGGILNVQAGNSYVIASSACIPGTRVSYEVSATDNLDLEYFQDSNPAPIGLYITAC